MNDFFIVVSFFVVGGLDAACRSFGIDEYARDIADLNEATKILFFHDKKHDD